MNTSKIKIMDEQQIINDIREKRNSSVYGWRRIVADYNVTRSEARRLINLSETNKKKMEKQKGLSVEQLRSKHDNHFIIQKTAEKLVKDRFLTESEFKMECNFASNGGYKDAMSHPDFSKFKGRAGGTTYWGHPDTVKKLKDESVLKDA